MEVGFAKLPVFTFVQSYESGFVMYIVIGYMVVKYERCEP